MGSPALFDVTGRRVVLTGASRGLGSVLAAAFRAAGARLVAVARGEEDLRALHHELGGECRTVAADVTSEGDNRRVAETAVAELGGIDVWICNAGISPILAGPIETPASVWRRIIEVNLTGAFLGARAAAEVMEPGGRIIVTGSVLGERPRTGLAAYSASKAGLVGLVKALALDLAPAGLTVNAVNPGWFDSPLTEAWQADEALERSVLDHTAQKRWGASADLPGAYLYLASPASDFVTGSVLTVDGGYSCV